MNGMEATVKFVAELAHVREVSLFGTADLDFWAERLGPEGLVPAEIGGRARVMIVAADARFRGIRFRELSFSVLASPDRGAGRVDGAYLARAFNSVRFFAFCERVFFSTPYDYGDVRVSTSVPASVQLSEQGQVVFRAEMGSEPAAPARATARSGDDGFEGPVFLPSRGRGRCGPGKLFLARLRGDTEAYPFLPSQDVLTITPPPASPSGQILRALTDSRFAATEWAIRRDATHAKSRTYGRAEWLQAAAH